MSTEGDEDEERVVDSAVMRFSRSTEWWPRVWEGASSRGKPGFSTLPGVVGAGEEAGREGEAPMMSMPMSMSMSRMGVMGRMTRCKTHSQSQR